MFIKNKAIVKDEWRVLRLTGNEAPQHVQVAQGKVIVPLDVWLAQRDTLMNRKYLGVWLASDDRVEVFQDDVVKFAVIAVDFPRFSDGRGFTMAYLLRERLAYKGELRAIGDVLRDQIYYMQRVGFDAFSPRSDKDMKSVLQGLNDFPETYQASADQQLPLYRRVQRGGV